MFYDIFLVVGIKYYFFILNGTIKFSVFLDDENNYHLYNTLKLLQT